MSKLKEGKRKSNESGVSGLWDPCPQIIEGF